MSDLISRQATLKHIEKIRQEAQMLDDTHRTDILMRGMCLCERVVRNQPPAQQERKMGKLVKWGSRYKCNQCNLTNEYKKLYCPNCGAKMDGEQNG